MNECFSVKKYNKIAKGFFEDFQMMHLIQIVIFTKQNLKQDLQFSA